MNSDRMCLTRFARSPLVGVVAGATLIAGVWSAAAQADPAEDAVAKLGELSRQAEQLTESMHSAQIDLDHKVAAQSTVEQKHLDDLARLDSAKTELATYQVSIDTLAAAVYMGGRTDGLNAVLTAASPQGLIDKMAVQRVMATEMSAQMKSFRRAGVDAVAVEAASAQSAAEAKTAAEQAAAVRADLQGKQTQLQVQIAVVKSRYVALSPIQQAALAGPSAAVPSALAAPVPDGAPSGEIAALAAVPNPGSGSGAGAIAVQAALTRLGSPYVWGGAGPSSFDCSGLVMWAFQNAGVYLPHSSQALSGGGQPVSMDQMQPGDVITYYSDASHVGLYIGDGMMVHASTFGVPVAVVGMNNAPIYSVRRY